MLIYQKVIYYLYFHPSGGIRIFTGVNGPVIRRRSEARNKVQVSSQVWINPGRVLHPRPAVPNIQKPVCEDGGDFQLRVSEHKVQVPDLNT